MLAHSDLHRSIARLSLNLHQAMARREALTHEYRMGEYEVQFQFNLSGRVGTLPIEAEIDMPFGVLFFADVGNRRNSRLDRPLARLGMELTQGPAGLIPYSHVAKWERDDDHNYTGAVVRVGFHLPAMAIMGAAPPSVSFRGMLHAGFQGFGAPMDPDSIVGEGTASGFDFDIGVG